MASHKYEVGQELRFKPNHMSTLSGAQQCKITRLMPMENGSRIYRIKCIADNLERVAIEHQLSAAGTVSDVPPNATEGGQ